MPAKKDMPSTIQRSSGKAQRTWGKAHDNAVEQYGEGERAHRTAFASLKHTHEKVEDRWARKKEKGPSDPRSKMPTRRAARGEGETFGGVDFYGNTRDELYERARQLGVEGRSRMTKVELARAIGRRQG
jgi:uncharacterized protein YjbJ (UPF0337 family)